MPPSTLLDLDGQPHRLPPEGAGELTFLVFLKTSCGACKTAFPYVARLAERYAGRLTVWGVSQSGAEQTRQFAARFGCRFPFLLDSDLAASRAYDPPGVPAYYLLAADGRLMDQALAFNRDELERLNGAIAAALGTPATPLFGPDDSGPAFRPACQSNHRLAAAGLLDPTG